MRGLRTSFERFTERARQVVNLAQQEARDDKSTHIDEGHVLMGVVLEEEGLGSRVLRDMGVTAEKLRDCAMPRTRRPGEWGGGLIPFTPEAKKTLELSLREALSLGCNYIGTEHLLLGLLRHGGLGVSALLAVGADPIEVRQNMMRLLLARPRSKAPEDARSPQPGAARRARRPGQQTDAHKLIEAMREAGATVEISVAGHHKFTPPRIERRRAERLVRDVLRELGITYPDGEHEQELIDRVLDHNPDVEDADG